MRKMFNSLLAALLCLTLVLAPLSVLAAPIPENENIAKNKEVTVSGVEGGVQADGTLKYPQFAAAGLTDGSHSTRWSSNYFSSAEPAWATIDLGSVQDVQV